MAAFRRFSTLALAALFFATPLLLAEPSWAQEGDDPAVAMVNGAPLRLSEVKEAVGNLPQQYLANIDGILPTLVERLVDFRLITEAGKADGLADDAEVAARLAKLKDAVIREIYLERFIEKNVTEEALRERYDAEVAAGGDDEVHARHILVNTEEEALAVIAELDAGADFAELAKEKSTGPSGPNGGDLGFFKKEQMVPAFAEAAFAMAPGEHSSEPVLTQFGFHVIMVEDRRVPPPPSFESRKADLESALSDELMRGLVDDLREGAEVEVVKIPLATEVLPE